MISDHPKDAHDSIKEPNLSTYTLTFKDEGTSLIKCMLMLEFIECIFKFMTRATLHNEMLPPLLTYTWSLVHEYQNIEISAEIISN